MKTLAELMIECQRLGLVMPRNGRSAKQPIIDALRKAKWEAANGRSPLPEQVMPMLLCDWTDLDVEQEIELEADQHQWIVQPKLDGVRALIHIESGSVRITGRSISDVTFRLTEHQNQLTHLTTGLEMIDGTILDGELVCPVVNVDTGKVITTTSLQAVVALLATSPANSAEIQLLQNCHVQFHAFDILKFQGNNVTEIPLRDRMNLLVKAIEKIKNEHYKLVPTYVISKPAVHARIIDRGDEGTVWKNAVGPYEPGRRVKHWIKRKRSVQVEAFVTGFKLGTLGKGYGNLVGAIEFSIQEANKITRPIAWVSGWSDADREKMTWKDRNGNPTLNPTFLGCKAIIVGQDETGRSRRIRHAGIKSWMHA
jgi:ATP-dependent DNA ligase